MAEYAHPELLVSTDWVDQHKSDEGVRLVEVDVETSAYAQGHIPGAIAWAWNSQLCDTVQRDIVPWEQLESLLTASGIKPDTTIVLYGDNNNWFAAWALWQLKIYGHNDVRILNGGRKKWIAEGRELTKDVPSYTKSRYPKPASFDFSIRALLPKVMESISNGAAHLVDVPN
jgi:thiosulfate/3-mercaptopyruvate sulfurtransferase